eukprot:181967-Chlamydomonas_euryale.AAC.2
MQGRRWGIQVCGGHSSVLRPCKYVAANQACGGHAEEETGPISVWRGNQVWRPCTGVAACECRGPCGNAYEASLVSLVRWVAILRHKKRVERLG